MFDYIGQLLKELLKGFASALWKFFTEFYQWVFEQIVSLIQGVLGSLGFDTSLQWANSYWENLNFFFPVNEVLAMLTVVFAVWLACFTIKIALKIIPTVY